MVKQNNELIKAMKDYAEENNVPIMSDEGIAFLTDYGVKNKIKKILEIGTTIERDEKRYLEAIKNVKKAELEDRIHLIYNDALEVKLDGTYDLVFIDAAKAQNIKFFEKFKENLIHGGVIITDNMKFHGLVDKKEEEIESRNLRQLVRKIKEYKKFLDTNEEFETTFKEIGDGLAISIDKRN